MIRGFARPIRRLVAQLSIVCIFLTGIPAVASAQGPKRLPTIKQLHQIAEEIERKGVLDADRINTVRTLVAIATAPNSRQQGTLIRQLPVSITLTARADGRLVKNFFSRGKLRLSVAERTSREQDDVAANPHSSGPSVTEDSDLCFDDEQPPCSTEAEMDELGILIAYNQGEMEAIQVEVEEELMLMACCNASEQGTRSGPNAASDCVAEGFAATGAAVSGVATTLLAADAHIAARAAGKTLSVAARTGWGLAILGAALVTVAAYNVYKSCKGGTPDPWHLQHWFEPVY